jgi:uncharacterized protein YndB with AHSA1/START domain
MTRSTPLPFDPALDLLLERIVDVPPELVWKAWTTPEILMQWFTPRPWTTVACDLDLRPGGIFRTVMRSPEGKDFPNVGCCLDVVPGHRFVWTSVLGAGYRPHHATGASPGDAFGFTAFITVEEHEGGTRYTALVRHGDPESRKKHEDMGFHGGWSTAFDQLVAMVTTGAV